MFARVVDRLDLWFIRLAMFLSFGRARPVRPLLVFNARHASREFLS
jgi:hypothetical protein